MSDSVIDEIKTNAEILGKALGCPCSYCPIDEEMMNAGLCENFCGTEERTYAKCWLRYFDLKKGKNNV